MDAGGLQAEQGEVTSPSAIAFGHREFRVHIDRLSRLRGRCNVNAPALSGAILREWFQRAYPLLDTSAIRIPLALHSNPDIASFAAALSQQPLLDAAYWLSSAYAKLLLGERRKALSMYFTPPLLAIRVLDDLASHGVRFDTGTFLDPACGGAAFLVPIALRMRQTLQGHKSAADIIRHVESHLCGMDLDEPLCALSRQLLRAVLYDEILATAIEPTFAIVAGNSLLDAKHLYGTADVVVCNPPYRKMVAEEIDSLRGQFEQVLAPQTNLYGVFVALCVNLLKDGAVCAVVTPTSFLSGSSFSRLRGFLGKQSQLLSVGVLSAREGVFIDVQQETAVTMLRRDCARPNASRPSFSLISPLGEFTSVGTCDLPLSGAAWPIPRVASDVQLIAKGLQLKHRLADYGYQARVGSYVWNRDERKAYSSAREAHRYNPKNVVPLMWSSDIKPGKPIHFDGSRKANGERRFVVIKDKTNPSVIRKSCVLLQRVTSNDQRRRLIAAAIQRTQFQDYGGFVGENHTVILVPVNDRSVLSPTQLAQLLGCTPVDRLFRCISGATNVSVFELGQLPLPDPKALKHRLDQGLSMEAAVHELMTM